jgi:SulP family sulfate permease
LPNARAKSLARFLPLLHWWPLVGRDSLRADLLAGLIGAVVVLPQGVAFATLAGMPPEYGLYAAMVPTAIAALFGSSLHAVTGPTNAVSLLVFATVAPLAEPGSAQYVSLVLTLSFMAGVMMLAMGALRLGTLVNFISHTVVVGFTAGAAVLIITSQLRNFFGLEIARGASFLHTWSAFFRQLADLQLYVLLVAAVTLVTGVLARRWLPKVPYMITAMVAGGVLAYALNSQLGESHTGVRTLGALPGALPRLSAPAFDVDTLRKLLAIAVAVVVLGLTEAVSIARAIALKSGQRVDGNQEFIGQGLANIVASFFSGYPSSASFNRSGINYEAGARTPLSAVFAAGLLIVILIGVAPLVAFLPIASMAAILFLVAWGLFDFASIRTILGTSRAEAGVLALTFFATLLMELEFAILVGVTTSLVLYLNRTSRPRLVGVAPDPAAESRRFREVRDKLAECPQVKMLRVEGSIYFGAVSHVDAYFDWLRERAPAQRYLVLMSKGVRFVDVAGAELLAHEARRRRALGGGLYFHGTRPEAEALLRKHPFVDDIGPENFFATKGEAIGTLFPRLDRAICARCRARVFLECASLPPPAPAPASSGGSSPTRSSAG